MSEEGSWFNTKLSSFTEFLAEGAKKTRRAFNYVTDGIVNYGKCFMCKEEADCNIPCGHILCHRCLNFYIESQGIPNPEFVLCYICQKPIPLENIPIDYEVSPYEEEKFPVYESGSPANLKKWSMNQEAEKFTIYEEPEEAKLPIFEEREESKYMIAEEPEVKKSKGVFTLIVLGSSSSSSEEEEESEEIKPFPIDEIRIKECPFCDWSLEIPTSSRYEVCKNIECNRTFCPQCNQIPHSGKPCSKKDSERKVVASYDPRCPGCLAEFIKEEGCNFLWCPNECSKTCFCLICETYIARCEYFTHYTKTGPFGDSCNGN